MSLESADGPVTDTWVAAIHATEDDFRPLGTAIVIDSRRVLTCAHLVVTSDGVIREPLWVAFPKADEAIARRRQVKSVLVADSPRVADLGLLVLNEDVPTGVVPATLRRPRAADLLNLRWWAFGFANGDPVGNSADGLVGASLAYGWIRLDTESRYHVAPGFSGGGLWSPDYRAVVGVVGEANDRGDGRAITLFHADLCFPTEKLQALTDWSADEAEESALAAWGWTLERDPEAGRHWRPRARGVVVDSERGFRFRGRTLALGAIVNWLDRTHPDRRALVVTGSPGVGKSAILGRIVTTADAGLRAALPSDDDAVQASRGSVACAVHAKGKTALDVAREIARAASAALPEYVDDIAPRLRAALAVGDRQHFNVIIDAVDEAATPAQARAIVTAIVLPLVETCADVGAQVVVGTRRLDDDGDLLRVFGSALLLIDLDDPHYFSDDDLTAYAMATLQLAGDERPGNPYTDDAAARAVAGRIAALSDRNFLITGLVARTHGLHDHEAADPARLSFTATVEASLGIYLKRLLPVSNVTAETILTVLAFAHPPGLPVSLWCAAVEAIAGERISVDELSRFARSSAGNFLVDSGGELSTSAFRLFHQALNDSLLRARSELVAPSNDEAALSRAFIAYGRQSSWARAPDYLRHSLGAHAARAGMIDDLLTDDAYLLHADLRRLIPLTDRATSSGGRHRARLLQLTPYAITASPQTRVALFTVTEALENLDGSYSRSGRVAPYRAKWASVRPRTERAVIEGHTGDINAVCTLTPNDRTLLASAATDRTVRIWDPATGEQQRTLEGHTGWVNCVCSFTLNDRVLLATAADDETVRTWDPATGEQHRALRGHTGGAREVCALTLDGVALLASAADDETVRIWNPATGDQLRILHGHSGSVRGVRAFTLNDRVLLASAADDETVRIWNPATGDQLRILYGHTSRVRSVCAFIHDGRVLLASAADDRTVRIWDPATGEQQRILGGHTGGVRGVCALTLNSAALLASAADDETVCIWNPATGEQQRTLHGHTGWVNSVCELTLNDRVLLASAADDRTVRIWDPGIDEQHRPPHGHTGWVNGICALSLSDRVLLASAADDRTVRIWDPETGEQQRTLHGHSGWVRGVCGFTLNHQVLLASASDDETLRIWDPATGEQHRILRGHTSRVRGVCGFTLGDGALLASAADDRTVRIWDPATGEQHRTLRGHTGGVRAVCAFTLNRQVLLATAADDATVRIWDPATGEQHRILRGHSGGVRAVCAFSLYGSVRLATAADDATIRIWDPATGKEHRILDGHASTVNGVCAFTLHGQILLASAADDRTVRIWDAVTGSCVTIIPTHHQALACDYIGSLVVALTAGLLAIEIDRFLDS